MRKHLDKEDFFEQMQDALAKISSGDIGGEMTVPRIMQFAADALCVDIKNENTNLTFDEFMTDLEALFEEHGIGGEPDEDAWAQYWQEGYTAKEALMEDLTAGGVD
jgi:hypothetical protein